MKKIDFNRHIWEGWTVVNCDRVRGHGVKYFVKEGDL